MITPTVSSPAVSGSARPSSAGTSGVRKGSRTRFFASDSVWIASVSALLVLAVGAMSLATKLPWLFAALGPTILLVTAAPEQPTARFHSIVVGHFAAFVCGWLALLLTGSANSAAFLSGETLAVGRVWASAFALAATSLLLPSLRAYHPPAAATALLVTLGAYRVTWKTALAMLAGVVVIALLGEWFRRIRLRDAGTRLT